MHIMKELSKQIENLIVSNVPQSIDLAIPVHSDNELKSLLNQLIEAVKLTNEKVNEIDSNTKAIYQKVNNLLIEKQSEYWRNIYGGKF